MTTMFAGKTKTGSKIHLCHTSVASGCNAGGHGKIPYYHVVSGDVYQSDLCKKCFGKEVTDRVKYESFLESLDLHLINNDLK